MAEHEKDLYGNSLVRAEEINLIYEGPSFEGQMEISHLTDQLTSTENIIREIISESYKQKGLKSPKDVKIYLRLKKGSFQEVISVIFNNPITANIIGGCFVALFTYFLTKKKENNAPDQINIGNLTNNYVFVKNFTQIIAPLEDQKDALKIVSSDPSIKIYVKKEDKRHINQFIKELKETRALEIYEEEFFGYLSIVNIDKGKYGFTLEGNNQHIPITFDKKPSLREIKKILGFRIKIKARSTYEEKELKKLDVINYEVKMRKNLKDFYGKK